MTQRTASGFRKTLGRVLTVTVTLMVCGAAAAAIIGGYSLIAADSDAAPGVAAPRTSVGVMSVELAPGYTVTRRFTGQIEAATRTDLGFELGGRITEVLVEEGDVVAAGTALVRLDISALIPERAALQAELAALAADAELARLTLARNDALTERGFRSIAAQDEARLTLARAKAGMAAVRARIAGVDVRLEKSVLTAPFAARIGARMADPGQTTTAGQTVLVLFDAAPARARVGLPPELAAGLSAGLSMLALAVFDYPFGINVIIGVIGSIGVSINAALIVLSGLQEDPRANAGDRAAMVDVVAGSARQITSTTITTFGGFLPLILGGGGFWPPFAMSVAGGVALSVTLAFAFTPQMFALTLPRQTSAKGRDTTPQPSTLEPDVTPLRLAGE